jgi:diacylglycerol kinase family enzyme
MESNAIRLSELKVGAIVNTSSGSCDLESEEKMLNTLKGAGIAKPRIWCGRADQMAPFFAEAVGQKLDVLIVLGGDGTIRTAAEGCTQEGPYLIPLPGERSICSLGPCMETCRGKTRSKIFSLLPQ